MRPVSSASGMNASGESRPRAGWSQRTSASTPVMRPVSQRHDRLVDEAQLPGLDAAGEVGLELEALEGAGVHLLLEELDAVLAPLLGEVHGHVGVAQHDLGRACPVVVDGDADAGGDDDLAAVDAERAAQVVEQPQGEADRADLVAAGAPTSTANSSPPSRAATSSLGRMWPSRSATPIEQLVADRVAEAVVDGLEVVEVDEQHAGATPLPAHRGGSFTSSANIVRLARPVSASWSAWWRRSCSSSLRRVTSRALSTMPPHGGLVAQVGDR